ncbi:MAG TPA: hypothetical protein DCP20_10280, partial [Coriobacteriia bacterium]|nr:hypothetical protein [Coriobacteriia bacterium]
SVLRPTEAEGDFVAEKLLGNIERHWTRHVAPGSSDEAYVHLEKGERALAALGAESARMSRVSRVILSNIDLEDVAALRRRNFATLAALIGEYGLEPVLGLPVDRVPHFLPIKVENRDEIRSRLREHGIYCPVHWPQHTASSALNDLWASELSLVIDQRYGLEDMERLSTALKRCISRAP